MQMSVKNVRHMARRHIDYDDPRRVLSSTYGASHPACFNDAMQYRQYKWLMRQSDSPKDFGHCLDCTAEHKAQMMKEGRCEHPETRFVVWVNRNREPETIGVSNESRFWHRVEKGESVMNWGDDGKD